MTPHHVLQSEVSDTTCDCHWGRDNYNEFQDNGCVADGKGNSAYEALSTFMHEPSILIALLEGFPKPYEELQRLCNTSSSDRLLRQPLDPCVLDGIGPESILLTTVWHTGPSRGFHEYQANL